jgi:hypothetical protein
MALREGDAWGFLKLKQQMVEADHLAVFSDGRKLPVFIYNNGGQTQYCIEGEGCFYDAQKYSGFVRFEKSPEPFAPAPPPPEPTEGEVFEARLKAAREANPGTADWILRKQITAQMFQEGLAAQQRARQEQQSDFGTLPDRWASFAAAAKRQRNNSR